jgi:eukaryotic-like serine/threonine-protein kinase
VSDDPMIGRSLLGRFELTRLIGRGGMATVYEARDSVLGRIVAIKVFTVDTADDRARIDSEVRLLSRLSHPNLVTVHDAHIAAGPADAPSFLVMELVAGTSLREVTAGGRLATAEVARIAADVASALSVVHGAGIVHRDVKPANILIERSMHLPDGLRAKLADFGIAHAIDATRLTAAGTVIGTAAFLSPEQAEGAHVTTASDIYSLGLVLLEAFKGEPEYPGTVAESLAARLSREPSIPGSVSPGWSAMLARMLSREPTMRPTAVEVARSSGQLSTAAVTRSAGTAQTPTAPMPTALMPTRILPANDASTVSLTANAVPNSGGRRTRRWVFVGLGLALVLVILTVLFLVAHAQSAGSTGGTTPTPGSTPSTTSSPSTSSNPSPAPTVPLPATPPGNGKGKGHGKKH